MRRDVCIALLAALLGAVSGGSIVAAKAEKPDGYVTEYGDFVPFSCEKDDVNNGAFADGTERFLINTGPTHKAVCKHMGYVSDADCEVNPKWDQPMVTINYKEQHQVCVTHMPGTYSCDANAPHKEGDQECPNKGRVYSGDVTRCFDLYDIGER